jgi:hypothetical protein
MLNKCSADNKHVIVELCEDILVDTIVLANLEFFSSTFREFRISVSDRYPIQERGWKTLGVFSGTNSRTLQVFTVENPLIWARYLRIEFLSHYGSEFYCPLTLLRVHGTTMMEEYKNQENSKLEEQPQEIVIPAPLTQQAISNSTDALDAHSLENGTVTEAESVPSVPSSSIDSANPTGRMSEAPPHAQTATIDPSESSMSTPVTHSPTSTLEPGASQTPISSGVLVNVSSAAPETNGNRSIPPLPSPDRSASQSDEVNLETTNTTSVEKSESSAGVTSSANPATQESVYKTITKRLTLLEANATLSLRYIEEQSQLLRDVFGKMERRHSQRMESFLSELNSTLVTRLQIFVRPVHLRFANMKTAAAIRANVAINHCGA